MRSNTNSLKVIINAEQNQQSVPHQYTPSDLDDGSESHLSSDTDVKDEKVGNAEDDTLFAHNYRREKFIANTLQGKTFTATRLSDKSAQEYVVKTTSKDLYKRGITITKEGKAFNIKEDIVKEARMMRKFMENHPPSSLIEFEDFFEDDNFYYLVMRHGGVDFFDFVVKCHELINAGKLTMKEWRKQCKFIFAQMVQFVKWLHDTQHYAHLDISLENLLISKEAHFNEDTGKLSKCYVKFIDFGLSEHFDPTTNPAFVCTKYVGKTHYKAPKVYNKKEVFRANKADIWSLGVCLFMMVIGAPPYNKPIAKDAGFRFIADGKISKLLYQWGRIKYVTPNLYDLMERMLTVNEANRITMDEIVTHKWLKIYFPEDQVPATESTTTMSSTKFSFPAASAMPMTPIANCPCSPQIALSPKSPTSMSPTVERNSATFSQQSHSHSNLFSSNQLNVMVPQQAVSISATPRMRAAVDGYGQSVNSPRSRSPDTPKSPCSAYSPRHPSTNYQHMHYTAKAQSPFVVAKPSRRGSSGQNTPTPIIESHTAQHDHSQCFASVTDHKTSKKKNFNIVDKLSSLSIFGSSKKK
eukprot:CAMPEP_0202685370 /NCGR_PEP_ID=MMETSP1385-20130828/1101_1 /ASSEMBLY_ACC=CAM_ASM_000861 /TAXON_ID=933848 /ORGANISM="Elphidium margaritaceum" /LENGTH=580 /DNA_ID=CAMNT_0049339697 /DNA_START=57 /DNA_END=1799 /DNA_ORIENTATION=+